MYIEWTKSMVKLSLETFTVGIGALVVVDSVVIIVVVVVVLTS